MACMATVSPIPLSRRPSSPLRLDAFARTVPSLPHQRKRIRRRPASSALRTTSPTSTPTCMILQRPPRARSGDYASRFRPHQLLRTNWGAPVGLTWQSLRVTPQQEGAFMAVLIRHRVAGMDASQYDEISPPLVEKLKTQPGFMYHVAYDDNGTFTVGEVWETQEQHDRWFNENVKPKVPGIDQEVVQLHAVHTP